MSKVPNGYPSESRTIAAAVGAGMKRGTEIFFNPDAANLRRRAEEIASRDVVAEAWQDVGEAMTSVMSESSTRRERE